MGLPNSRDTNRTAAIVAGAAARAPSARARAARSRLEHEGYTIEAVDALQWRVNGFGYWPEIDMWKGPDGRLGRSGLPGLIEALRQAGPAASGHPLLPPSEL